MCLPSVSSSCQSKVSSVGAMSAENVDQEEFPFRIQIKYIAHWIHEFDHFDIKVTQRGAVAEANEAFARLLVKRDLMQKARGVFHGVSIYPMLEYPPKYFEDLFAATQDFYHTYYTTVSAFISVVKRFPDVFGDCPSESVARFIKWWSGYGLFMDSQGPLLESARAFRALMEHKQSNQVYQWHSSNFSGRTQILLTGEKSRSGAIPPGASNYGDGWWFPAPDEDLVTTALSAQLNNLLAHVGFKYMNHDKALACTWQTPVFPEDTTQGFPIFAATDFTVARSYRKTVETRVRIDPLED